MCPSGSASSHRVILPTYLPTYLYSTKFGRQLEEELEQLEKEEEELEEKEEEELEERVDSRARVSHPSTSSHRVIRAAKSLTMKPLLLVPHAQRLTRDNGLNISSTIFINRYHNQQ